MGCYPSSTKLRIHLPHIQLGILKGKIDREAAAQLDVDQFCRKTRKIVLYTSIHTLNMDVLEEGVACQNGSVTRKLVPPTVGPGGPIMAIQDCPGPTMAATNGPTGPAMAAIIGPPLPSLVPWPGDLPWQP